MRFRCNGAFSGYNHEEGAGRRTFITRAARSVHKAGGSLKDVQELAGHSALTTTKRYIEGDRDAQRRLVRMI
jgi:integrase/recombinase XerD